MQVKPEELASVLWMIKGGELPADAPDDVPFDAGAEAVDEAPAY